MVRVDVEDDLKQVVSHVCRTASFTGRMDEGYRIVSGRSQVRVLPLPLDGSVAQLVRAPKTSSPILARDILQDRRVEQSG
jgi:hypothetical protein